MALSMADDGRQEAQLLLWNGAVYTFRYRCERVQTPADVKLCEKVECDQLVLRATFG